MPKVNSITRPFNAAAAKLYLVEKGGLDQQVHILGRRTNEIYVHYIGTDKRLDEWILDSRARSLEPSSEVDEPERTTRSSRKRQRSTSRTSSPAPQSSSSVILPDLGENMEDPLPMTEEEYDIQHHKQITAQRNFDKVNFGKWQIKTWYFSPYPVTESEAEEPANSLPNTPTIAAPRIPGVHRATVRSHGRTSDLLAGGLGRSHGSGEHSVLWVCDRCFKYMADGLSWELHTRRCAVNHPPGRKVYQRGAHTVWEVDGAKEKLYCQNLSLFGKLFIDIKTLFFDCDNFLFYLLTDAASQRDHVIGFFSKEKVSYDDYNLACIITFPPYQKKGFGLLMIEFSYEISRRAGKVGTPERPLSDLGLRSYLSYWASTLLRFLRRLLTVNHSELGVTMSQAEVRSPINGIQDDGAPRPQKKKRNKGWDGEMPEGADCVPSSTLDESFFASLRTLHAVSNPDGSATTHLVVKCTLQDLAKATNLRVEDAAFALNEIGLLNKTGTGANDGNIMISREMVEAVAKERGLKVRILSIPHVLL